MTFKAHSLSEPPGGDIDVLGDALAALRFTGSALYRSEMQAPWAVESPSQSVLKSYFLPDDADSRVAMFHAVVEGDIVLEVHTGEAIEAGPGDIVIITGGEQHVSRQGQPEKRLRVEGAFPRPGATVRVGDTPTAVVMCGMFVLRNTTFNPLLEALPETLFLKADSRSAGLYSLLLAEFTTPGPGRLTLLDRAAEMLFILAVREVATKTESAPWFRAIHDPHVGRAIRNIHRDPAADWTVEKLASLVGVSRSGLAARFQDTLELSPGKYLTRWRMNVATRLLPDRSLGLSEVAERVGYTSEFAFSRAFKRHIGVSPSSWRKLAYGGAGLRLHLKLADVAGSAPAGRALQDGSSLQPSSGRVSGCDTRSPEPSPTAAG